MKVGTKKVFCIIILLIASLPCKAETVMDIDARADRYYSEKKFSEAIREWLSALDLDPSNEKIQRKIEMLYEQKHRKNLAVQRAKIIMRETIDIKDTASLDVIEQGTKDAVDNFVVAYRIDPNDPEIKTLRPKMEKFQNEMLVELEKRRRSESDKRKYREAVLLAQQLMNQEKYEEALGEWNVALDVFVDDPSAKEGKRKAELAISNRLKYEKIKSLLTRGIELYNQKNYNDSLVELKQALLIDPANDEADVYIGKIEDVLDFQRSAERKRQQSEQFYQAGIDDLAGNRFNEARDNFENALSLIPNYKDANARINSIKKLRDEYNERLRKQKLADIEKEFENGLINFAEGKYKEALSSFERTVVIDPKNTLARGYLDKTKDALRAKQEEEVDPSSPYYDIISSLIISGTDLYNKGRFVESRERWEKIRLIFPNNRIAIEYILRCDLKLDAERFQNFASRVIDEGKAYLEKNDTRNALSRFQMIKSIDPAYPKIDELVASAQVSTRFRRRPGTTNQTVVTSEDVERHYQAGLALYQKGGEANLRASLEQFRWIAQNDPENMKSLIVMNKIESQLRIGSSVEAVDTGPKLTDNQKRLVGEYYFRGINYYSNNNYEKAIDEWRKVLAIDPANEKAKNNIRKCLALLKK